MESLVYGTLPSTEAKELNIRPQGPKEAEGFVNAFLKRSIPGLGGEVIKERLNRKAVILQHSFKQKKREKPRKRKGFSAKKKRELRLFEIKPEQQRYNLFLPLHDLWKQYIRDLCNGLRADAQPQMIQNKLLKADLHGAFLTVKKSKCPSYVGLSGIVVQEMKHVFKIITKDDKLKVIPKVNTVFSVEVDGFISYIYGSRFQLRSSERSAKKFKMKGSIDL
ncbi:ribonuclease P protein subunit p29 [Rhinatrema bivittatum]|uniref:ribonuclease P protein subunit p29 n=1 Tax=Rhinatrema bivittatum TaxID=194408 RepID=UPI00112E1947|nr:ribonuclease P protein subunit p29 [Rhinatrema bivittatum]XP_029434239.1 ribonuclease P protein subunit p29 [Rhinatrema bivittatum]XP_029434240.1 ribonuclease P protein subunit p29 [Rhinatrema bivittatum]XP_029434241.1 ribonuclease P protein subunit p29 [Rhinatrema bivittatum]